MYRKYVESKNGLCSPSQTLKVRPSSFSSASLCYQLWIWRQCRPSEWCYFCCGAFLSRYCTTCCKVTAGVEGRTCNKSTVFANNSGVFVSLDSDDCVLRANVHEHAIVKHNTDTAILHDRRNSHFLDTRKNSTTTKHVQSCFGETTSSRAVCWRIEEMSRCTSLLDDGSNIQSTINKEVCQLKWESPLQFGNHFGRNSKTNCTIGLSTASCFKVFLAQKSPHAVLKL